MLELIIKFFFAFLIFCGTTICGIPIIFRLVLNTRWLSKIVLSYVVGFILLSLSGIVANAISVDIFTIQLCMLVLCIVGTISLRNSLVFDMDRTDQIIVGLTMFYIIILIAYFDWIVMWMAGDAVAHASIIRMLIDGYSVPVSIYPFGSYWEYYPKAFHFYSFFWAKGGTILSAIQVIPVLLSAIIPVILYSILRELRQSMVALYAFVLSCFCFPAHYAYLIWAGYPSIAAEMILVGAILSLIVNWRLLPIFFIGLLFTHTRFIGYLVLILLLYGLFMIYESPKNQCSLFTKRFFSIMATTLCGFFLICLIFQIIHPPHFIISLIADRTITLEYIARWFWGFFALFGLIIAFIDKERERTYRIFILWFIAIGILFFLSDVGILGFFESPDRLLSLLYIPLSAFAAILLYTVSVTIPKSKIIYLGLLILIGLSGMGAVFYSYANSWGLPKEDFHAISWINSQKFQNALCINLDGPGEWVYPLAGVKTAYPRLLPKVDLGEEWFMRQMIDDPEENSCITAMKNSGYAPIFVYISNISLSKPGYTPPFNINTWGFGYILHPEKYSSAYYDVAYDNGTRLFKLKNN